MVEKICQHIEKLLGQHDYVVVPNLGGFVVQMQSAVLLPDRITPPLATIGFNPLLHHSDGLLAIEIARTEGISYRVAMEFMDKEVEKIKAQLNAAQSVQFGNMGLLRRTVEGNLLFLPIAKADFLPSNFELNDLAIAPRDLQTTEERRKVTFMLPTFRAYKYAAASMLIVGLLMISPQVNDMQQAHYADLTSMAFINAPEIKMTPTDTVPVKVKEVKVIAPVEQDNFHVVVASLADQKTADQFCKELVAGHYSKAHVLAPTRMYRVAIQSFSERKLAIQFMEKLRQSDSRFETAWVSCK